MARGSKKRQQDPAPFDKPVRKDATVRSGGKRKRVDASGKVIKPASKGPKIATSKSKNAEEGSEGSEDEGLDAARAAFFDQEDLDEDGQGGFDGLEQSDEMQDGSELGSEEEEEQDEFSELGDDPLAGEDSPQSVSV